MKQKPLPKKVTDVPVARARFQPFPQKVRKAFENPVDPDHNLAMAAEARQILDLKMGAAFTRFVTLSVRKSKDKRRPFNRALPDSYLRVCLRKGKGYPGF